MWTKINLSSKFTLLLAVALLAGLTASGLALWNGLNRHAEQEITTRALLLIDTMTAVRAYTSNNVNPLLQEEIAASPTFISESVPSFSARQVFENFRGREGYETFLYKEAALNPTNPRDLADAFEADLVTTLRNDASLTNLEGYRMMNGEALFYVARPQKITAESCLACHSTPAEAPPSLVATFGSTGGFGWQLGETVGAQIIYVPTSEIQNSARQSFALVMSIFAITFVLVLALINWLTRHTVVNPLGQVAALSRQLGDDTLQLADLEQGGLQMVAARQDELGQLAAQFKRMAQDVYTRQQQLRQQVRELRIQIDEAKKQEAVQEIIDSEFFRELEGKAATMRARQHHRSKANPEGSEKLKEE